MNRKGFILVEFLVATFLFSLAGSGLYTGLIQGIRAKAKAEENFRRHDAFRIFSMYLEKDLRNAVSLQDHPFEGRREEIRFPTLRGEKLLLVRYFVKNKNLIRSEEELTSKLTKKESQERVFLKDVKSVEFLFPYRDEEGALLFHSFWLEEPYGGIPRGVKIKLEVKDVSLAKTISIPQGKIGHAEA